MIWAFTRELEYLKLVMTKNKICRVEREDKMTHKMNIWDESFIKIKNKTKTIEMRLYDEKRSLISIGDIIGFINTKTNEVLECVVVNLYKYKDFYELYKHHNKISIGYSEDEIANPNDMLTYYSAENINRYGVLGIEIAIK